MSAFDVVLPDPIPFKGVVLNQLTLFWMDIFRDQVDNHLLETDIDRFPDPLRQYEEELDRRAVIARRAQPLPLECIVRGYLSGSGWQDYQDTGVVCGYTLPDGLRQSDKLPEPLFTPSTKADVGDHDENITLQQAQERVGSDLLKKMQDLSLSMYKQAQDIAESRDLIIADTKFEFGIGGGSLCLIDEVLTPDSSRFWPRQSYEPGYSQPSFDKQYLRDWLNRNWNRQDPPPSLPSEVIEQTQFKYMEAYRLLTGKSIDK
jgi:phosphoribosylaminoimidazole-succinocarboxamide synthase